MRVSLFSMFLVYICVFILCNENGSEAQIINTSEYKVEKKKSRRYEEHLVGYESEICTLWSLEIELNISTASIYEKNFVLCQIKFRSNF